MELVNDRFVKKDRIMKKKTKKNLIIVAIIGVVIIGVVGAVIFLTPHRDVKNTKSDFSVQAKVLVDEYLSDATKANDKYLSSDGDSKIFDVKGRVDQIFKNQKDQDVILLKADGDELGVQCTFLTGENISDIELGQVIKIKGKIEQGASYDEDLELGEDVILGDCSLVG